MAERRGRHLKLAVLGLCLLTGACSTTCELPAPPPPEPTAPRAGKAVKPKGHYKVGEPYRIGGVWYRPQEDFDYLAEGKASWYGESFHGKPTANGEQFDQDELTAAHQTLPLPSVVRVTNLENGRSVTLRVNDRGPFVRGRILDVSRKAARLLKFQGKGTTQVRIELLEKESREAAAELGWKG